MKQTASYERREYLKSLLGRLLDVESDQRQKLAQELCGEDARLHNELIALLNASDDATGYFETLANDLFSNQVPGEHHNEPQERVKDREIGRQHGHYKIVDKLGGGGMGVVYKAHHSKLDRPAALKFLPPSLSSDDEARTRFAHEARAASALDHPNICTIYDIDQTDSGQVYIAMAYYDGETLKKKISKGPLGLTNALDYAAQIAEALSKAHAEGIIHRDIKPANIMVTSDDTVKLLDFGVAKVGNLNLTQSGTTLGTVAYMSPEQMRGEEIDHRTDIWSLGVVLFEMLTGKKPYRGDYDQAIVYAVLNGNRTGVREVVPAIHDSVERIVDKCLEPDLEKRYQTTASLFADLYRERRAAHGAATGVSIPVSRSVDSTTDRQYVFVSYKRASEQDANLAESIVTALSSHHDVFIDKMMLVGARWIEQIESEMGRAGYLIVLLSEDSVNSEMVVAEIEMARRLAEERGGQPRILPVRVSYDQPFAYPLSAYLNGLNWVNWNGESDTTAVVDALRRAVKGGSYGTVSPAAALHTPVVESAIPEPHAVAQPDRLEMPEGTMDPQSSFYIARTEDQIALRAIEREGVTITIKGPRQMGKSSLLMRTMAAATNAGKEVVFLDFQLFDNAALADSDTFFRQFCRWITDELDLDDEVDAYWQRPLGNSQRTTRYVGRHVLNLLDKPLLLAMDEVERVFDTEFRSDFFSMLRSWHNDRAIKQRWRKLDLALVTSTEPYQLIQNLNQSPFNVGEVIALQDFSADQVEELNRRHGSPVDAEESDRLMRLLGGHPYLVRKALFLIASGRMSAEELVLSAKDEHGPFGDHLRNHLFRLHRQEDLKRGMKQVLKDQKCDDEGVFWRLRGAGLVWRGGRVVTPRCQLYADYFEEHLDV